MGEKVRNSFNNIVEKQELRACDLKYIQNTIRLYSYAIDLNLLGFIIDLSLWEFESTVKDSDQE